jgi:hypothetical protein
MADDGANLANASSNATPDAFDVSSYVANVSSNASGYT